VKVGLVRNGSSKRARARCTHIKYAQSATDGEIVCKTALDRRSRTAAVLRGDVRHEDGRLPVTAIGSHAVFPPRRRSAAAPG
jgi:acyl-coenzyme A thioesterase PaaI-like protein